MTFTVLIRLDALVRTEATWTLKLLCIQIDIKITIDILHCQVRSMYNTTALICAYQCALVHSTEFAIRLMFHYSLLQLSAISNYIKKILFASYWMLLSAGSSVSGEYTVKDPGGSLRIVSYHADKEGFHAVVHTSGKNDHSGGVYGGQGHDETQGHLHEYAALSAHAAAY